MSTHPEKRKVSAHIRGGKAIAETEATRHVGDGDNESGGSAEHLRGKVGLTDLATDRNVNIEEYDRPIDLGFTGIFRDKYKGPGLNVEAALMSFELADGTSKTLYFSTDEPIGREESLNALHEKAQALYPGSKEILANREYRRYQYDDESGKIITPDLPEWLANNEPVPADDMKAAVDYFVAKSGGTRFYGADVVLSGEFPDMNREEASQFLSTLGATAKASLSKGTAFVIADPESETSKVKKAKELGIPVVTPEEVIEEATTNTAAWQAEEYRRNRRGSRFSAISEFTPGVISDRWNSNSPDRAMDHESAIARVERNVKCAHVWGAPERIDTRDKILRTGRVFTEKTCTRCGERKTVGDVVYHRWSGD